MALSAGAMLLVALVAVAVVARDEPPVTTDAAAVEVVMQPPAESFATDRTDGEATDDADAAALAELNRLREESLSHVTFAGQYVAQLASKSIGLVDPLQTTATGSHTFYAADILAEYEALRQRVTDDVSVVLILSTDFGKRQLHHGQPLWISVGLGDFSSGRSVRLWCGAQFPELTGAELANQCTARRLRS